MGRGCVGMGEGVGMGMGGLGRGRDVCGVLVGQVAVS